MASNIELGINHKGILFYDGEKVLHEHPFSRLLDWAVDKKQFHICFNVRGHNGRTTRLPSPKALSEEDYDSYELVGGKYRFHPDSDLPPAPVPSKAPERLYPSQNEKVLKPRGFFGQWSVTVHSKNVEEIAKLLDDFAIALLADSRYALALETHKSPLPELLNFEKEDVVEVIRKNADGWFEGKSAKKAGFFPAASVQMLFEAPRPGRRVLCKKLYLPVQTDPLSEKRRETSNLSRPAQSSVLNLLETHAAKYFSDSHKKDYKHSTSPISSPLTMLPETDQPFAVEMSSTLLRFTGDLPSGQQSDVVTPVCDLLDRLLRIPYATLSSSKSLAHEFLAQLLRLTTSNPNHSSSSKAWELLVVACSVLGVHEKDWRGLVEQILKFASETNSALSALLEYAYNALQYPDKYKLRLRSFAPTFFELRCLRKGADLPIKIELPTKSLVVSIHP